MPRGRVPSGKAMIHMDMLVPASMKQWIIDQATKLGEEHTQEVSMGAVVRACIRYTASAKITSAEWERFTK